MRLLRLQEVKAVKEEAAVAVAVDSVAEEERVVTDLHEKVVTADLLVSSVTDPLAMMVTDPLSNVVGASTDMSTEVTILDLMKALLLKEAEREEVASDMASEVTLEVASEVASEVPEVA